MTTTKYNKLRGLINRTRNRPIDEAYATIVDDVTFTACDCISSVWALLGLHEHDLITS